MKTRNFEELRAKLSPKALKRADLKADRLVAKILAAERGPLEPPKPESKLQKNKKSRAN